MNINDKYIMETVPIGKGSFADVFRGSILLTGEIIAVKRVSLKAVSEEDKLAGKKSKEEELLTEINVMKSLNHPNIVKYYDVVKTKDYWYIIMEYCDSGTFADVIDYNKQHKIDRESTTAYYMSQLKDAMRYIRSKGVMHRDIKPMNILLTRPDKMHMSEDMGLLFLTDSDKHVESYDKSQQLVVKMADFGLARNYIDDEHLLSATTCGSPLYMAPEILVGPPLYNSRIDLWAYGIIFYQMLFGFCPLSAKNIPQLKTQLKQKKIDFHLDHNFTAECFDLLTGLLEKNHEVRITWNDFLTHEWFQLWDNTIRTRALQRQPQLLQPPRLVRKNPPSLRSLSSSLSTPPLHLDALRASKSGAPNLDVYSNSRAPLHLDALRASKSGAPNLDVCPNSRVSKNPTPPIKTTNLSRMPSFPRSESRSSSYSPNNSASPGSPYNQFRYSRHISGSRDLSIQYEDDSPPCYTLPNNAHIIDEYMSDAQNLSNSHHKYIEYGKNYSETNPIIIPRQKTYTQTAVAYLSGFFI